MPEMNQPTPAGAEHVPTILEAKLDSISLMLNQMKSRVRQLAPQEHMTETERAELEVSLARAESKLTELGSIIRGSD